MIRATAAALLIALLTGCPQPPEVKYQAPKNVHADLPENEAELIALADKLIQGPDLSGFDRARGALQKALKKTSKPIEIQWRLARACFLMAHGLQAKKQIVDLAKEGLSAADATVKLDAKRVEGHYYRALNMSKIAEAKSQLKWIKRMLAAAKQAAAIDSGYDRGGPLTFIGKVYLEAPAWPVSIGNSEKAVEFLQKAVAKSPTAMNRIFLAQAYYADEQNDEAKRELNLAFRQAKAEKLQKRWRAEAQKLLKKLENE